MRPGAVQSSGTLHWRIDALEMLFEIKLFGNVKGIFSSLHIGNYLGFVHNINLMNGILSRKIVSDLTSLLFTYATTQHQGDEQPLLTKIICEFVRNLLA